MFFRMLRSTARTAIHRLGLVPAVRALHRRSCRILVYHRFGEDHANLAAQCEHIRKYYQPVSMRQVAECLRGGTALPNSAVAITIDDGYRDFLLHGHPVFTQYEIPVTVFVITGFIDGELWPWWDQLTYMFRRTRGAAISFSGREVAISGDILRVIDGVTQALKRLPRAERNTKIDQLQQELGVELPKPAPPEYQPLSWEEVRGLSTKEVEFGGHTRTHPILSCIADEAELRQEIAGSKMRLDEQLGFPSLHFAYPNGTPSDYDERTVAAVRAGGFVTAVTLGRRFVSAGADCFRLARLDADPSLPLEHLVESLAGLR
jgi:peptidoglycan/xylan/chitin deacetylase (PgdA/CDA1 family)